MVMRSISFILAALLPAVLALVILLIFSIPDRHATAKGATFYDPAKEVVVKGAVEKVWDFACPESNCEVGQHLLLRTGYGDVEIHLAPARMMRHQPMNIAVGDKVEVVGAQVRVWDRNDVLAREITRGANVMVLRDRKSNLLLHQ